MNKFFILLGRLDYGICIKNISAPTYCERIQNIEEFIAMSKQYSILSASTVNTYPLQQFLSYIFFRI
ncbi:hypothetical protein [Blochmannia endosymbiont of Camponotus modoc]|uniref:hypothetical protein n=1 Tax=Blochmannia endosymbiont of Camponotus modoc TaxID=2945587 RepID=UPI002024DFB9|nr:hypothetical protein [Blochmannia endosymbiont of Camponotus modoc]URJ31728.1 hypothetical protein M9395_03040 [Blochmannia endosymbiont of Camponotus modoc]